MSNFLYPLLYIVSYLFDLGDDESHITEVNMKRIGEYDFRDFMATDDKSIQWTRKCDVVSIDELDETLFKSSTPPIVQYSQEVKPILKRGSKDQLV